MEEQRNVLVKLYNTHHLHSNSDNSELPVQCQKFLTSVTPKERFSYLGKEDVWKNITKNIDSSEDICQLIEEMKTGFYNLEKYAVNLSKFPWRKEYHTIKLYTGFFKLNILQKLNHSDSVISILRFLGYTRSKESLGHVSLQETVDDKQVTEVAFDLFLAQVELEVVRKIVKGFNRGEVRLGEVFRARMRNPGIEEAVEYLRRKIAKNQKLDQDAKTETMSPHRHHQQMDMERSTMAINGSSSSRQGVAGSIFETGKEHKYVLTGLDNNAEITAHPLHSHRSVSYASSRIKTPNEVSDEALYGVGTKESYPGNISQLTPQAIWRNDQFVVPQMQDGETVHEAVVRYTSSHEDSPRLKQTEIKNVLQNTLSNVTYKGRAESSFEACSKITADEQNVSQYRGSRCVMDLEPTRNFDIRSYSLTGHDNLTRASATNAYTTNQSVQVLTRPKNAGSKEALCGNTGSIQTPLKSERTHATGGPIVSSDETKAECSPSTSATYERPSEINGRTDEQSRITDSPVIKATLTGSKKDKNTATLQTVNVLNEQRRTGNTEKDIREGFENLDDTLQTRLTFEEDKVEGRPPRHSTRLHEQKRRVQSEDERRAVHTGESSSGTSPQNRSTYISTDALQTWPSSLPGMPHRHPGYEDYESKILVEGKVVSKQSSAMAPGDRSSRRGVKSDRSVSGPSESARRYPGTHCTICDFCEKQGFYICRNCFLDVCEKCKRYYSTDLCAATKGTHSFVQLKAAELSSSRSATTSLYPEYLHTADSSVNDRGQSNAPREEWSCKRCTFLNPPDHQICSICASTRGVDGPGLPEPGSRVCKHCTFYNKEGSKVCETCHRTMDLTKSETCL